MNFNYTKEFYNSNTINKLKLLLSTFLLICLFCNNLYAQTEAERKEYYKNIMAKGETIVKTFNTIKKDIQDKIFSNEHDGISNKSEFQCVYTLFLTNFFKNSEKFTSEFDKMNNFSNVPDMSYLKQMNTIQEKKLALLSDGIKFFEEISTEINSKPFKRWDAKVIDNFVSNYKNPVEFEMYKQLRPICQDIFLLNLCRTAIAYLKCTYTDWTFMAQSRFKATSDIGNPLYNYNMICYKQIFDHSNQQMAWQLNRTKIDNIDTKLDFSKLIFKDYPDNFIFSSWTINSKNLDKSRNKEGLYSVQLANANNTLSLLFLNKSLDFESTALSQLFKKYKLEIKDCTYDQYLNKYQYNYFDHDQALLLFYENKIFEIDSIDRESIRLLLSIFPKESPFFYLENDAETYRNLIKKFDPKWFDVYQIKKNIILSSAILLSVTNELEINSLNSTILHEWFNEKMEANQLKAYFQNEYMKKFGKNDSKIWSADNVYLEDVLNKLRLIKSLIKANSKSFEKITSTNEFNKFLDSNIKTNITIDNEVVISNNSQEIFYRESYLRYKQEIEYLTYEKFLDFSKIDRDNYIKKSVVKTSDLYSLGWRSLENNHLESAEKYFLEGIETTKTAYEYSKNANASGFSTIIKLEGRELTPESHLFTLNLAHVMLFKGDYKKAKKLYTKYPMDQKMSDFEMDVKTFIKTDFDSFIKIGRDPKLFEEIKKDLGL